MITDLLITVGIPLLAMTLGQPFSPCFRELHLTRLPFPQNT